MKVLVVVAGEDVAQIEPMAGGGAALAGALDEGSERVHFRAHGGVQRVGIEGVHDVLDAVLGHLGEERNGRSGCVCQGGAAGVGGLAAA